MLVKSHIIENNCASLNLPLQEKNKKCCSLKHKYMFNCGLLLYIWFFLSFIQNEQLWFCHMVLDAWVFNFLVKFLVFIIIILFYCPLWHLEIMLSKESRLFIVKLLLFFRSSINFQLQLYPTAEWTFIGRMFCKRYHLKLLLF